MIKIEKLSQGSNKTIIDTGSGGAKPYTWSGLNLVRPPLMAYREGTWCDFTLTPTTAGLEFANTNTNPPGTALRMQTGIIPAGRFFQDSDGILQFTMHVDNFVRAMDIADNFWMMFVITAAGNGPPTFQLGESWWEHRYGLTVNAFADIDTKIVQASANEGAVVEKFTHDDDTCDEFEVVAAFRRPGLGAPQAASIVADSWDHMYVDKWVAGVPQVRVTTPMNRQDAGSARGSFMPVCGLHMFFGVTQYHATSTFTGRLTFVRMDRGVFIPYV